MRGLPFGQVYDLRVGSTRFDRLDALMGTFLGLVALAGGDDLAVGRLEVKPKLAGLVFDDLESGSDYCWLIASAEPVLKASDRVSEKYCSPLSPAWTPPSCCAHSLTSTRSVPKATLPRWEPDHVGVAHWCARTLNVAAVAWAGIDTRPDSALHLFPWG